MGEVFEHRDEIEAWLNTQPRDVISVFAARAALRAVPRLRYLIENVNLGLPSDAMIASAVWAMSSAISKGLWPDWAGELRSYAFSNTVSSTANAALFHGGVTHTVAAYANTSMALATTQAAAYAAYAAHVADDVAAFAGAGAEAGPSVHFAGAEAGASAHYAASSAQSKDVVNDSYSEHSWDRDHIGASQTAMSLASQKLWNGAVYSDVRLPSGLTRDWEKLKTHLIGLNADWEVWTEWYEARLDGKPLIKEIEIGLDPENQDFGRVTLPPKYYVDPAKANAAIKKIIAAYWERHEAQNSQENAEVPALNPASIKPVIRNGKIYLSTEPIDVDIDLHLAIANMLALRDEFEEFYTSIKPEDNFDKRPVDFLKTISTLIPDEIPDSRTLFRLIRKEAAMEKYEPTGITRVATVFCR